MRISSEGLVANSLARAFIIYPLCIRISKVLVNMRGSHARSSHRSSLNLGAKHDACKFSFPIGWSDLECVANMFTDAFDSMLDATRIGCEYFYQGHTKVINDTKLMNMHGKIHQNEKGKAPNISLLVTNLSAF